MTTRALLRTLPAFALLAGCAVPSTMPARQDPFAGLGLPRADGGLSGLNVALIASANTHATVDFGHRNLAGGATDKWLKDEFKFFERQFGKAVHARSLEEAWAGKPDLVIVLDVYEQTNTSCKYDETAVFLAPGGTEVERVHGKVDIPFRGPFSINAVIKECVDDMQGQIETGIQASKALQDLARVKAVGAPATPQADAAPSGPSLPDILHPTRRAPPDESAFALVVGVEKYSRIPQADYAERDARAVSEHLEALGFPRRNIIHLSGQEASYSSLKKYLESWLPKNAPPDGKVFFYFSGHGAPDASTGEAYLLPWDGDPAFLKDTAYPTKRLFERLAALPARDIVVAMDACFSGAGGRSALPKGARPLVVSVDAGLADSQRLAVFAASGPDQITGTLDDKGHGMFTYYFLKGLDGGARDTTGRVTLHGLQDYLKPKVQDEARRQNRDQDPILRAQDDRELVRFK